MTMANSGGEVNEKSCVAKNADPEPDNLADFRCPKSENAPVTTSTKGTGSTDTPGWTAPPMQVYDVTGAQTTVQPLPEQDSATPKGDAQSGSSPVGSDNGPSDGHEHSNETPEKKPETAKEEPIKNRQTSYDADGNKTVDTEYENGRKTTTTTSPDGKEIHSRSEEPDGSYKERTVNKDGSTTQTSYDAKTGEYRSKTTDANGKVISEEFRAKGNDGEDADQTPITGNGKGGKNQPFQPGDLEPWHRDRYPDYQLIDYSRDATRVIPAAD